MIYLEQWTGLLEYTLYDIFTVYVLHRQIQVITLTLKIIFSWFYTAKLGFQYRDMDLDCWSLCGFQSCSVHSSFGNECWCHCAVSSPNSGGGKRNFLKSPLAEDARMCPSQTSLQFWQRYLCCGQGQNMTSSSKANTAVRFYLCITCNGLWVRGWARFTFSLLQQQFEERTYHEREDDEEPKTEKKR